MIVERQNRLSFRFVAFAATLVVVAACGNQQTTVRTTNQLPETAKPTLVSDKGQAMNIDEQVAAAKQDLAEQLGTDADEIEVETVRTVHWRSGAAGCPKPGMSYTMAIVPGVLILLSADGDAYHYHAGIGRAPFYCPPERVEAPAYGMGDEAM